MRKKKNQSSAVTCLSKKEVQILPIEDYEGQNHNTRPYVLDRNYWSHVLHIQFSLTYKVVIFSFLTKRYNNL